LEQQLAPKQDKTVIQNLNLRLLYLLQHPIQNQYEIQIIKAQLDQQLQKKLTPKQNMERYTHIQFLLTQLTQQATAPPSAKPPAVKVPAAAAVAPPHPAIPPAVRVAAAAAAAPHPAIPLVIKKEIKREVDVNIKKFFTFGKSNNPEYKTYIEVDNTDGQGFYRALGYILLREEITDYAYKTIVPRIDNTFGYVLSEEFDTKVVSAIKTAALKLNPSAAVQSDIRENNITNDVMKAVIIALKTNILVVNTNTVIKGDDHRQVVDAIIQYDDSAAAGAHYKWFIWNK
jgi:hypothetical protein